MVLEGDSTDSGDSAEEVDDTAADSDSSDSGGGDTASGGDSGVGTDSGSIPHGTLVEITFGDGDACTSEPFTDGGGGSITASMIFSDGAGSCGVFVYGSGSAEGPSGTKELLYAGSDYTSDVEYTANLTVENTLSTDAEFFATFGGGEVASTTVEAGATITFTVSWKATSESADLTAWSTGTDYDLVLHGVIIEY